MLHNHTPPYMTLHIHTVITITPTLKAIPEKALTTIALAHTIIIILLI